MPPPPPATSARPGPAPSANPTGTGPGAAGSVPPPPAKAASEHPADLTDDVVFVDDEGAADAGNPAAAPAALAAEPTAEDLLREQVAQLTAERDRMRDQLIRTTADFDNFRKRTRRELADAAKKGKEDSLREVLPVIDNLERAVQAAETAADAKSVADGVRMVLRMFDDAAQRLGLERLKTLGERFDPMLHEAVQQVETADVAPGTITIEVQAGYRLGDRLIRPAIVAVAKAPAAPSTGEVAETRTSIPVEKAASVPPAGDAGDSAADPTDDEPSDA
jgi:molecular chaperone GrpE